MGDAAGRASTSPPVVGAAERYRALVTVTGALARAFTVDEVVDALGTSIVEAVGASDLILAVVDDDGGPVRFHTLGLAPELVAHVPAVFDRSATGEVLRTGEPNFLGSRRDHDQRYPATAEWWESAAIEASASLPLTVGGRCFAAVRF